MSVATALQIEEMTPLFVIEEHGEWRLEFYDDGSVRYVDFFEGITEIIFDDRQDGSIKN
ncbi:MAG: hypothetical protein OWQ51_13045 [Pyrobaculum arsenaticum]|uniref:hypothetical protein n=1 Tax=Pyrobaculum arsenaticum TaxID=121277 RepID=UPI002273A36A|nr:hypothetical protein [Pyrobaculum arsenaticum]